MSKSQYRNRRELHEGIRVEEEVRDADIKGEFRSSSIRLEQNAVAIAQSINFSLALE